MHHTQPLNSNFTMITHISVFRWILFHFKSIRLLVFFQFFRHNLPFCRMWFLKRQNQPTHRYISCFCICACARVCPCLYILCVCVSCVMWIHARMWVYYVLYVVMWDGWSDQCVSQARNKLGWLERKTQLWEGATDEISNANSNLKPIILPVLFLYTFELCVCVWVCVCWCLCLCLCLCIPSMLSYRLIGFKATMSP